MANKVVAKVPAVQKFGVGVTVTVEGDDLVIRIKKSGNYGPSASGKNVIVASTKGNQVVDLGGGKTAVLGLNLYTRA